MIRGSDEAGLVYSYCIISLFAGTFADSRVALILLMIPFADKLVSRNKSFAILIGLDIFFTSERSPKSMFFSKEDALLNWRDFPINLSRI